MRASNMVWQQVEIQTDDQLGFNGGIHMHTTVQIAPSGQVKVSSRAANIDESADFMGLIVLLYGRGQQPEWLWNTSPVRFGAGPLNRWDQATVQFTQDIPPNVLACARYAAVKQFVSPSPDVWADIKPWLAEAQAPTTGFDAVRASAQYLTPAAMCTSVVV